MGCAEEARSFEGSHVPPPSLVPRNGAALATGAPRAQTSFPRVGLAERMPLLRSLLWLAATILPLLVPIAAAQLPTAQGDVVPWGLHVAYGVDPRTSASIGWLQPRNADQLAALENRRVVVEYGPTPAYGMYAHVEARPFQGVAAETPFAAFLTGLQPNTTYHYRIGSTVPGWSPDHTFKTAPETPTRFTVTVYGDQGTGRNLAADRASLAGTPESHPSRRVVAAALSEKPDLHLHVGDLSYDDWDEWQALIEPLAADVPYMVVAGNHDIDEERNLKEYDARMVMPSAAGTYYYAFTYGSVRFIGLDSENACERGFSQYEPAAGVYYGCGKDPRPNQAQIRFLAQELARARADPDIRFVVPFLHRPLYSDGEHGSTASLQEWWGPLFDEYKPELVLAGHDHLYERSKPLVGGAPNPAGSTHIVTGGAGHGLYDFQNETLREWEAARAKAYHYMVLEFDGDTLRATAKDLDGNVIDAFTLASHAQTWDEGAKPMAPSRVPSLATPVSGLLVLAVALHVARRSK